MKERVSFWKKIETINYKFKTSLLTHYRFETPKISDKIKNIKINKKTKRAFSFLPSSLEASLCVETSLSFSFFIIFFVNVISIIFIYMVYVQEMGEIHQKGKKISAYAYTTEIIGNSEQLIRLNGSETVSSIFPLLQFSDCRMQVKCVVKPWTGYDVKNRNEREKEEELVYITEHGEVYHRSRGCSHLSLSIDLVAFENLIFERNMGQAAYTPCEYCFSKGDNFIVAVYITKWGNRYHRQLKCQGLKRSIKCVPLSEVGGLPACSKCGG